MNENCFSVTYSAVPTEVDSYHSLFPLEPLPPPNRIQKSSNFGYITSCYKAVNSKDDLPYCLRRIHGKEDGFLCQECIIWAKIVHTLLGTVLYLSHMFGGQEGFFSFSSLFVPLSPPPSPSLSFLFFVPNWKLTPYRQNRPFLEIYISLSFVVDYSRNFSSIGFRLVNTKCMVLVDMWKKIQHSNIVTLREVFTTKAFAEPCKLLVLWWFCSWVSLYGVWLLWCVFLFSCKLLCSHMISMLEEKLWWADTLMTLMQMPTSQRESGVREMWADYALMHAFLLRTIVLY